MSAWVRPARLPPQRDEADSFMDVLVHGYDRKKTCENFLRFRCYKSGAQRFEAGIFLGVDLPYSTPVADAGVGEWTHWLATYREYYWHLYRNGELVHRHPLDLGAEKTDAEWVVGGHADKPERSFCGAIDEVRIYNRAFKEEEALKLFHGSAQKLVAAPRFGSKPVDRPSASPDNAARLLAHWPLDEGEGDVAHDVVGDAHGAIEGATWTDRDGKRGALRFDGFDDAVDLSNPDRLNIEGQISLAAWIKPKSLPTVTILLQPDVRNILSHGDIDSSVFLRTIALPEAPAEYSAGIWSKTTSRVQASAPMKKSEVDVWTHLTVTYNGETWTLYKNGVVIAQAISTVGALPNETGWVIGADPSKTSRFFDGDVDYVRIYAGALTPSEVKELFNNTSLVE